MGIAEFIIDILSDDYLVWDSGVITCKDKMYPVIRIKDITDSMGRSCIRLEYYSDLSASEQNLLKEETIPVGDDIDVIVKDISDRMESFEWYDNPDNYGHIST